MASIGDVVLKIRALVTLDPIPPAAGSRGTNLGIKQEF